MKKIMTLGLVAGALALTTAAFAPTEAQANDREKALNQLAMQMYMNNMAAQGQYYNNPYYGNPYYNNGYGYGRYINGNGYWRNNHYFNNNWNNGYYNNGRSLNTVGRILNRIF
ncbi:MAG: hypothetical protein DKT66_20735 [Candidatus Melainabacteria bacterium]|nr:MAG: hypothetical protein DKT66_20735 [Candidatus Melainabacteria bacterium]